EEVLRGLGIAEAVGEEADELVACGRQHGQRLGIGRHEKIPRHRGGAKGARATPSPLADGLARSLVHGSARTGFTAGARAAACTTMLGGRTRGLGFGAIAGASGAGADSGGGWGVVGHGKFLSSVLTRLSPGHYTPVAEIRGACRGPGARRPRYARGHVRVDPNAPGVARRGVGH